MEESLVLEVGEARKGPGCLTRVGEETQVLLGAGPHTSGAHRSGRARLVLPTREACAPWA